MTTATVRASDAVADEVLVRRFDTIRRSDISLVGGKNASLGEMINALAGSGIRVPPGFATTAAAYRALLGSDDLRTRIARNLGTLAPDARNLAEVGAAVRRMILETELPASVRDAVLAAYRALSMHTGGNDPSVAVRSSATAEDLPEASFAGQLETFLNVRGEAALLQACKRCYASLFTDRAIVYRRTHGFDHMKIALSIGVQLMVRSDKAGAGVMFSIDTETGFRHTVLITAAWGLGELVVQGSVDPDEYQVFKPLLGDVALRPIIHKKLGRKLQKLVYSPGTGQACKRVRTNTRNRTSYVLNDAEVLQLARWACAIEAHYGGPMDIEWAKDGDTGELFIVQARPETVQSRRKGGVLKSYTVRKKGTTLISGLAVGDSVAIGQVCRLKSPKEIDRFGPGAVLVAETTDPDWLPVMKKASAIVTDRGGRTSHAAIVSRELGLPAIVGATGATSTLHDGIEVTVSCAEGDDGHVYEGRAQVEVEEIDVADLPATRTRIMINAADPSTAFQWWRLPTDGVGLARMEFIIGTLIRVHPMALVRYDELKNAKTRTQIDEITCGYADRAEYFVDTLARGLARIAAAHYPNPVIVRLSDFKTNEYARLIGGAQFEPSEENPMLGWRGASRYYSPGYREGFALECRAIRRARENIGLGNIVVMVPFCRSPEEADRVLAELACHGLVRGAGLEVYVMCEIPSNVILAERFAERFDGFSIGSNDLTQLVLGVDRDNATLKSLFDERSDAVKEAIDIVLAKAHVSGTKTGICGQAPSDYPDFARFLVERGIDSISVTPDSFVKVKRAVAAAERATQPVSVASLGATESHDAAQRAL